MQKIGLIGYPIDHSLSPAIFREKYGENNPSFSYDLIQCRDFHQAISIFKNEYYAINVTAPFKEKAYKIADVLDENSKIATALNLLVKGNDGRIWGYNTDVSAVRIIISHIMKKAGIEHPRVLVVGMGGAGKSAAAAALMSGAEVVLCNRSLKRMIDFEEHIKSFDFSDCKGNASFFAKISYLSLLFNSVMMKFGLNRLNEAVKISDIIIYALPRINFVKSEDNSLQSEINIELLKSYFKGKWVVEANYRDSMFNEKKAEEAGFHYVDGIKWLRLQADETFKIIMR